jgi:hypothetical protein
VLSCHLSHFPLHLILFCHRCSSFLHPTVLVPIPAQIFLNFLSKISSSVFLHNSVCGFSLPLCYVCGKSPDQYSPPTPSSSDSHSFSILLLFPCLPLHIVLYIPSPGRSLYYYTMFVSFGRLCCLVIRVPGYRSRGPGFDSRRYQIF